MTHQTEEQFLDDENDFDNDLDNDFDNDLEADDEDSLEDAYDEVSKSQLKRDSKDLQRLGKQLTAYSDEKLGKVPLGEKLLDAILLAQKLSNKRGALKRHFQYIGKILRSIDVEPILAAMAKIEDSDNSQKLLFKKMEYWRDRIISEGDPAINDCCEQTPSMDRQRLRQLSRNYKQAASEDKKTRFARQIFKEIQACLG